MKLIHQILGLILGFIIGILTAASSVGVFALWIYSDTKKNSPKYRGGYIPPEKKENPLNHVYRTEDDALAALDILQNKVRDYGIASLSDLKAALGLNYKFADLSMGWNDLSGARVLRVRDGYCIEFPNPEPVRKDKEE